MARQNHDAPTGAIDTATPYVAGSCPTLAGPEPTGDEGAPFLVAARELAHDRAAQVQTALDRVCGSSTGAPAEVEREAIAAVLEPDYVLVLAEVDRLQRERDRALELCGAMQDDITELEREYAKLWRALAAAIGVEP